MQPFHPVDDATVTVSVSSSTARGALKKLPTGRFNLRIHNALTEAIWYRLGDSSVTVTTSTGVPIPAGAVEVIDVDTPVAGADITHIAFISASGSGSAYATTGWGL